MKRNSVDDMKNDVLFYCVDIDFKEYIYLLNHSILLINTYFYIAFIM